MKVSSSAIRKAHDMYPRILAAALAVVLLAAGCGDDTPDPATAPDAATAADLRPPIMGDSADVTPLAALVDARDSIEQAHEGIGNVIKNDISGDNTCGDRCYAAMQDARQKNLRAWHEVRGDVLSIRTWDKNQTVGHAFDAADYWLAQLEAVYDIDLGKHAEYQLGILRDVLRDQVDKRTTPTTTTVPYRADHFTFSDLSADFDGWATLNTDMAELEPFLRSVLAQLNDTPAEAGCFTYDTSPDTCPAIWQQALDEWRADCDPPRGAANVTCGDGDDAL